MISQSELERLAAIQSADGILSVYLHMNPSLAYDRDYLLTQFKSAVTAFLRSKDTPQVKEVIEREERRVLDFLRGWEPHERGLVIFSGEPAGIWEVITLDVGVPTFVNVDTAPDTAILAQVLAEYPRICVVILERDHANIYEVVRGQWIERAEVKSLVPGQHDEGVGPKPIISVTLRSILVNT
jgi:hypothetical protein